MARIVICDKNVRLAHQIERDLAEPRHEIHVTASTRAARDYIRRRQGGVDLLITEVMMPHFDGIKLITTLLAEFPDLRVIAISGGSAARTASEACAIAQAFGANAVHYKPYDPDDLAEQVRVVLRRSPSFEMA